LGGLSAWAELADLNGIAIHSRSQHLLTGGYQYAPLQALPTSSISSFWQVPPMGNGPGQFNSLVVDPYDDRVYYSTAEGAIRGCTGEGAVRFTAQCLSGHRCEAIVVLGPRIATWQRALVGGAQVVVSYEVAGTIAGSLPVQHQRIALFRRTVNSLLLFANNGGQGVVQDLNLTAFGTPVVRTFNEGEIRAVVRMDQNNFVVAVGNGLVGFNYATNTVSQLTNSITANAMAYEPATGVVLVAQGTALLVVDPTTGTVINTYSTGMAIGHILPLQNR
jgi:hypothetical protein